MSERHPPAEASVIAMRSACRAMGIEVTGDGYVWAPDAAALMRVSCKTLRKWRYEFRGPAFRKVGDPESGRAQYSLAEIDSYLSRNGQNYFG